MTTNNQFWSEVNHWRQHAGHPPLPARDIDVAAIAERVKPLVAKDDTGAFKWWHQQPTHQGRLAFVLKRCRELNKKLPKFNPQGEQIEAGHDGWPVVEALLDDAANAKAA